MKVEFPKKTVSCLQCIKSEVRWVEETQELRMPEQMPDVGRILCCWGQVLLRSKEWRDGTMAVSGGVMAWVMYLPEGENSTGHMAQAWIPFQLKWDLPQTKHDGTIRVLPLLQSVDARTTTARKIVVRATVSVLAEAFVQDRAEVCVPEQIPEGIHLLQRTYPMILPRESGEKTFEMDEELTLPQSAQPVDEILRFSFHPELIDRKVLSGKVVFRGSGLVHVLYRSSGGELCSWDFEIPFAQYAQLDTEYEQEAQCTVVPILTGLELDGMPDGKLRLKAAIAGQYMIYDTTPILVAEDAYSIGAQLQVQTQPLQLPSVLALEQKTVSAEQPMHLQASNIIDTAFYPWMPRLRRQNEEMQAELGGVFHMLYRDETGTLQGAVQKWQSEETVNLASNAELGLLIQPSGRPQGSSASGQTVMRGDILLDSVISADSQIPMISALEMGEVCAPDPDRPNLILQRLNGESLWDLAKMNGSTVERIRVANGLGSDGEPALGQMLLIPVL